MKLKDYYICDIKSNPVIVRDGDDSKELFLAGNVYGRPGFPDGSTIRTSAIASLNELEATTKSGSVYELDGVCPDYKDFLEAHERGIEILSNWNLALVDNIMINVPSFDDPDALEKARDPDNLHIGYMLSARTPSGSQVYGEVIGQHGNYVTVNVMRWFNNDAKIDVKEFFVVWRSVNIETEMSLSLLREVAGLKYNTFEPAFHLKSRPKIF